MKIKRYIVDEGEGFEFFANPKQLKNLKEINYQEVKV